MQNFVIPRPSIFDPLTYYLTILYPTTTLSCSKQAGIHAEFNDITDFEAIFAGSVNNHMIAAGADNANRLGWLYI